jgi:hypothetical protein
MPEYQGLSKPASRIAGFYLFPFAHPVELLPASVTKPLLRGRPARNTANENSRRLSQRFDPENGVAHGREAAVFLTRLRSVVGELGKWSGGRRETSSERSRSATPAAEPQTEARRCG